LSADAGLLVEIRETVDIRRDTRVVPRVSLPVSTFEDRLKADTVDANQVHSV